MKKRALEPYVPECDTLAWAAQPGANVNSPAGVPDTDNATVMHFAALFDAVDVVALLVDEFGGDAGVQDAMGRTPLFYAVLAGHDDVAMLLVARGADPDHRAAPVQMRPLDAAFFFWPWAEKLLGYGRLRFLETSNTLMKLFAAGLTFERSFEEPDLQVLVAEGTAAVAAARADTARAAIPYAASSAVHPNLLLGSNRYEPHAAILNVASLALFSAIGAVRNKPDWQRKILDPEIVARWYAEMSFEDGEIEEESTSVAPSPPYSSSSFLATDVAVDDKGMDDDEEEEEGEAVAVAVAAEEIATEEAAEEEAMAQAVAQAEAADAAAEAAAAEEEDVVEDGPGSYAAAEKSTFAAIRRELFFPCMYRLLVSEVAWRIRHGAESHWGGPGPYTGITELPEAVCAQLEREAAAFVESIPEAKRDWHPYPAEPERRDVLNLVHPSMYCLVAGRSLLRATGEVWKPEHARTKEPRVLGWSDAFQWLPAEVDVDHAGHARFASYINGLPRTAANEGLVAALEAALSLAVPMWEEVLGEAVLERLHDYTDQPIRPRAEFADDDDDWGEFCREQLGDDAEGGSIELFGRTWMRPDDREGPEWTVPYRFEKAPNYGADLPQRIPLRGQRLQVIVKLANIDLTPEQPTYAGGSWHIEGMDNERIVASAVCYYHVDNITESRLEFRRQCGQPFSTDGDNEYCERFYNMPNGAPLVQRLRAAVVRQGMVLAWSNQLQHRVAPFELADKSRPGARKIAAFFLVRPDERIVSSADVVEQQHDVRAAALPLHGLPADIIAEIARYDSIMPDEARAYRLELMKERSAAAAKVTTQFKFEFSLCEH